MGSEVNDDHIGKIHVGKVRIDEVHTDEVLVVEKDVQVEAETTTE